MRTYSKKSVVLLTILFGAIVGASTPCHGAEPERSSPDENARPRHDKPKTPTVNEALGRCFSNLFKAQGELKNLQSEGEMLKPHKPGGYNPFWSCYLKRTNVTFSATFHSEAGTIRHFLKRVFTDDKYLREIHALGYEIYYDEKGKVQSYSRRDSSERISFYPDGSIEELQEDIDDHTACHVKWTEDGKIESERTRPHLPRDEKGLPELEKALMHGSYSAKQEAAHTLANFGPASIPYALRVLKDGDEKARELVAPIFGFIREDTDSFVPALAQQLREDKSAKVRREIAFSLQQLGSSAEAAIPALEEAAANDDAPEVVKAAKTALIRVRPPSSKSQ